MPLKAILNGVNVQSYDYTKEGWLDLKRTYKANTLVMPCCEAKGIPKVSVLGTQYFSHSRRGECTSKGETKEHLMMKAIIAHSAKSLGWRVETEKAGTTPSGESWIADVFCEKGKAKVAFEVQWSPQAEEEYLRRTKKYADSGVRVMWINRMKSEIFVNQAMPLDRYDIPCFGIRIVNGSVIVVRYEVKLEDFIRACLTKRVSWKPRVNQDLVVRIHYFTDICWRCKNNINIASSLSLYDCLGNFIERVGVRAHTIEWVGNAFNDYLSQYLIGKIVARYSKTRKKAYPSNGCVFCNAIQGEFFVEQKIGHEEENDYVDLRWSPCEDEAHPFTTTWHYLSEKVENSAWEKGRWEFF